MEATGYHITLQPHPHGKAILPDQVRRCQREVQHKICGEPHYVYTVVVYDISKDPNIINSHQLSPEERNRSVREVQRV